MKPVRVLILGAAGRDFHNHNVLFRDDPTHEVVAFTAQQIPYIADRRYPPELAGSRYPDGIPIYEEDRLEQLIAELRVDQCVLSYSDLSHIDVMHLASRANAAGADFWLPAPTRTMLKSRLPVVAVCATRTGAGKSATSRAIAEELRRGGLRVAALRHPMPYGDLRTQRVQRFAGEDDLVKHDVTIEEREEYEPHIAAGSVVWAGVDYEAILREAEQEADVLIWDGGNNDTPFLAPDLFITVVDPHRAGHELRYHPGETNVRMADVLIINKVDTAPADAVEQVRRNLAELNPEAAVLLAESPIEVDDPAVLRNRRVLAVEDGPTLTHGGMRFGAAALAAQEHGATVVPAAEFAVGELAGVFEKYPHVAGVLPAMGYGAQQIRDLQATIEAAADGGVEAVAIGTPIDLARLVRIPVPHTRVRYSFRLRGDVSLAEVLAPLRR
jgi:predicted GTPase